MSVLLRSADKEADFRAIVRGAHDFAARIGKPFLYPSDPNAFEAALWRIIKLDAVEILLAEEDGRIVGGLGLLFTPFVWDPERLMAEEVFFWCAVDAPPVTALRLLRGTLSASQSRGATHLMMHVMSSSPPKLHQVLMRLGFEPLQSSYVKAC